MAICFMKIAKKTNTPNAWFAWVPILNMILFLRMGKLSSWFALLLIAMPIPFLNFLAAIPLFIISIIAWMKISERLGKPNWLGILSVVPIANIILPGYLAFSDTTPLPPVQPPVQPQNQPPQTPPMQ